MRLLRCDDRAFRALYHTRAFSVDELRRPNKIRAVLVDYLDAFRRALRGEDVGDLVERFATPPTELDDRGLIDAIRHGVDLYKYRLNALEVSVADVCDLSCRACCAAAPLVNHQDTWSTPAELERTLTRLVELAGPNRLPTSVSILGGEPTMHPRLLDILRTVRVVLPHADVKLVTNGHRLARASTDVFTTLVELNVDVNVSIYGPGSFFFHTPFTRGDRPRMSCTSCGEHCAMLVAGHRCVETGPCTMLPNGDLYFCSFARQAELVARHFNVPLEIRRGPTGDVVNIHTVATYEELLRFMSRSTTPFARFCTPPSVIPWGVSSKCADEWLDETW